MKNQIKYLFLLLGLTSCSINRNWESTQKENSFHATYGDFNGREKIELDSEKGKVVFLSCLIRNKKGEFLLSLNRQNPKSKPNEIIHQKIDLTNPLQIILKGNHANGEVSLEYPVYNKKIIQVRYNSNYEILCLAYFLSDMFEDIKENHSTFYYNGSEVEVRDLYALNLKIGLEFQQYQNSENLRILKQFFKKHWYLDYAKFVMNLPEFPYATNQPVRLNSKTLFDSKDEAEQFTSALNRFYQEINFGDFLSEYEPYYKEMIVEVKNNLPNESFISEMEHLYDQKAQGYYLNASLTMPFSQGYAISDDQNIGYVFGSFTLPSEINDVDHLSLGYANSLQLRNISVHEFGHSFVNHVVDQVTDSIIDKKEFLYEPIQEKMSDQAYTNWKTCLYEHFVRAGEIFIAKQLGDRETAAKLSEDYIENRKFIYLKQIVPAMEYWYDHDYFSKSYTDFVRQTIINLHSPLSKSENDMTNFPH